MSTLSKMIGAVTIRIKKMSKQSPSVKRLKKRRKLLDAIKLQIKEDGISSLDSEQRALYEEHLTNKENWKKNGRTNN